MLQRLRGDLSKYHALFTGGRCKAWELEELIVAAINSDTQARHHALWQERGHDDRADIVVRTNETEYLVQIKSGEIKSERLILSGHRLGRFGGDLTQISNYLNTPRADIITVPYRTVDGAQGRQHIYRVCYADKELLTGLTADGWTLRGKQLVQTNARGVEFSLRPSMSWQIWWKIPENLLTNTDEFIIE